MVFDCSQTSGAFDVAHVQVCFVQGETPFLQNKPGYPTLTPQADEIAIEKPLKTFPFEFRILKTTS